MTVFETGSLLPLVAAMTVLLVAMAIFYYFDVAAPRRRRRHERAERHVRQELREARFRFWRDVLRPSRIKRLTDQRTGRP